MILDLCDIRTMTWQQNL